MTGGYLPKEIVHRVPVLANKDQTILRGLGDNDGGTRVTYDLPFDLDPTGLNHSVYFQRKNPALIYDSSVESLYYIFFTHSAILAPIRERGNQRDVLSWILGDRNDVKFLFLSAILSLHPLEKQGIDHLYNLDFQAATEAFKELTRELPSSPAGPHYLASTFWMEEMTRRGAMAGETFQSSRYWTRNRTEPPSPELQERFEAQVEEAIHRSKLVLSARENDREALYFWGATESIVSAYEATIRRRYFAAYRAGRRALEQHEKLLKLDPSWADAHLVPGIYEYTMATLPRSVKILGFLIGMKGSKEKGAEHLRKAVRDGERTYWGARLSLIVLETREKRYPEALRYLRELEATFPKNPLFPLEKGWVYLLKQDWSAARRTFRTMQKKQRNQQPHYGRVHPSFVLLRLGESYLFDKRVGEALGRFDEALVPPDIPDTVRSVLHLRRGQAYDSLHRREEARAEYEATIRLNTDKASHRLAKRYLKEPYQLVPGN